MRRAAKCQKLVRGEVLYIVQLRIWSLVGRATLNIIAKTSSGRFRGYDRTTFGWQ